MSLPHHNPDLFPYQIAFYLTRQEADAAARYFYKAQVMRDVSADFIDPFFQRFYFIRQTYGFMPNGDTVDILCTDGSFHRTGAWHFLNTLTQQCRQFAAQRWDKMIGNPN